LGRGKKFYEVRLTQGTYGGAPIWGWRLKKNRGRGKKVLIREILKVDVWGGKVTESRKQGRPLTDLRGGRRGKRVRRHVKEVWDLVKALE